MSGLTVLAAGLAFPEGPAVAADGAVWVSELQAGAIVRIGARGELTRLPTGGEPNGIAHAPDGSIWFCDQSINAVRRLDPASGDISTVTDRIGGEPLAAPNDLAFTPDGGLVFTCPGSSRVEPTGYLCHRTEEGVVTRIATGLLFPNGVCLSRDGARVFVAETYGARVQAGGLRAAGPVELSPLVETPGPIGADGVAITPSDELATCVHGAGMIRLIDLASGAVRDVALPDARPAGCAADPLGRWSLIVTGTEHGTVMGITL